ncbi:MAG TPA: glycosyltransferase family 4 protein [Bacillota bacterium]
MVSWLRRTRGPVEPCRADIIEAHGWRAGWRARAVARRWRCPLIVVVHAYPPSARAARWVWRGLEHGLTPRPAAYVAVSEPLARWLRPQVAAPVHVVRLVPPRPRPLSPADARRALGLPRHWRVAGSIGRLVSDKGTDLLLRAWARLPPDLRAHWRLAVVGDGPERRRLTRLAAGLGVGDSVLWLGEVPGAGALVAAFDVYVQPSRREGLGLAALEAAAAGVPAVLSRGGGLAELARLAPAAVPPGDVPALAASLGRLLGMTPEERRGAGAAFRARAAARFPEGAGASALAQVYAGLTVKPRAGARQA